MLDDVALDVSTLPLLLAGPILRRLTRTEVTVWAAFSAGKSVQLCVRQAPSGLEQTASGSSVRIGSNLWLVTATLALNPGETFSASTLYEYWLTANGEAIGTPDFWGDLAYEGTSNPSFYGPPQALDDLKILHTSCRKPHGGGRDGLALADELITEAILPSDRPNLLILTGSQIYADDVAAPLMPRVQRVAQDLVGIDEPGLFNALSQVDGRQAATHSYGLTSPTAANHLWTFGEFAAMYLLAWSDTLWPADLPTWLEADGDADAFPQEDALPPDQALDEQTWNDLTGRLDVYRQALPAVRRVLANVPTLMIFGGHDISSDWNRDHQWAAAVYGNDSGRRIVTNGLLAYLLFQHWGNNPSAFGPGSPEMVALDARPQYGPNSDHTVLENALGLPGSVPALPFEFRSFPPAASVRYDYTLGLDEGYPAHVVVLDERMARRFESADSASRIAPVALGDMLASLGQINPDTPVVVVSPSPIFGIGFDERYLLPAATFLPGDAPAASGEVQHPFGPALVDLMQQVADYRTIFLSGGVRYGFTQRITIQNPPGTERGIAAQLTASAAGNADVLTLKMHEHGDLMQRLGLVRAQGVTPPTSPTWHYIVEHIDDETLPENPADHSTVVNAAGLNWTLPPPLSWQPDTSYQMVRALQVSDLNRIGRVLAGLPLLGRVTFTSASATLTVGHELSMAAGADDASGTRAQTITAVVLE